MSDIHFFSFHKTQIINSTYTNLSSMKERQISLFIFCISIYVIPLPLYSSLERLRRHSEFVSRSKIDLDAAQVTDVQNYRYKLF